MKQQVLFTDLGKNQAYKDIWDLQEGMLEKNIRLKNEERAVISESNNSVEVQPQYATETTGQTMPDKNLMPVEKTLPFFNDQSSSFPSTKHHLLFVEHNPVYTIGKSGNINNVLISEEERRARQIDFFKINRGGDITFHGPGQLVCYPILDLEKFKTDLGWYLRSLEEVIILTLAAYGVKGERSKGETGVWIDAGSKGNERKICAMGIRCSRWITMHGFAFNINTDLTYFNHIIPCGIQNKQVTSLQKELGCKMPIEEVKLRVKESFEQVFNVQIIADVLPKVA